MRLRPEDIHTQTFKTSFRGFDPVEVDGFLNRVADEIERLLEERENLEKELEQVRSSRRKLEEAMSAARHLQESMIEKAKEDARVTMNQAKLLADRLILEAREEVASIRQDARRIREKRSDALAELSALAHRLAQWVEQMERQDPEVVEPEPEEEPAEAEAPYIREIALAENPADAPEPEETPAEDPASGTPAELPPLPEPEPALSPRKYEGRSFFRLSSKPEVRQDSEEDVGGDPPFGGSETDSPNRVD